MSTAIETPLPMRAPGRALSLLVVCTGNICRSPVAERLLTVRLGHEVVVRSAGTWALAGQPIDPPMARLLSAAGGDPGAFVARQLTAAMVTEADLVLTMTRQHRGTSVELSPASVRRAFMVLEFAALLSAAPVDRRSTDLSAQRLRTAISLAVAERKVLTSPDAYDVPDPYRGSAADYLMAFRRIQAATDSIADVLTGHPTTASDDRAGP